MSSGDRQLSVRELDLLCTAFMALPGVRDVHARELYLEVLDGEVDTPLSFTRHPDLRHDMFSILHTCMVHGVIRKLVEVVRQFHPGTTAMVELDSAVNVLFPEEFLLAGERDQIVALLGGLDRVQLLEAFRYAGPLAWQTMVIDLTDPVDVVLQLESCIGRPDLPPPLLMFADYLAHQLDAVRDAEYHRWIDAVGGRKKVPTAQLRALCSATKPRLDAVGRYYFVVQLVPDGVDPDRYLTSAWLQRHGSIEEPLYRNDEALHLEEIKDLLPQLLSTAHQGAGGGDMTLEFILPRRLINLPIDQWVIDEILPHALGMDYAVVIRSLDRMKRKKSHRAWQLKSQWLDTTGHVKTPPESVMWLSRPGTRAPGALYGSLLRDDSMVALAMNFPPESSAELKSDELTAALYAGIPIILWVRDETFGSNFEKELRKVLVERGLHELPAQLLRLRREADEKQTLGSNITLIYDDYKRIPESFTRSTRLQAPQTQ